MVYDFLIKKTSNTKKETRINSGTIFEYKQLTKISHKPIIKSFEKGKVNSYFIDNIWIANLVGKQSLKVLRNNIGNSFVCPPKNW